MRWLLLAAAVAPIVLLYIVVRDHELSWPRGEMTAVIGIIAFGLTAYVGIIDRPGEPPSEISLGFGWYISLLGTIMIAVGGAYRASTTERPRKPPGVLLMPPRNVPDRNLALELVRVTEAAALAAGRYVGRGDKEAADQAAVDGMHAVLHTIHMDGIVVIGEGEKDEAPMLANGEEVGDGSDPQVDIAVDPLEGTRLCALGMPNALAVIALAERGAMFDPGPCVYMEKMAGGDDVADLLDLDRPIGETIGLVAERKGMDVGDVMVVVLDRPRHEEGIEEIRKAGGRVRLITDGDVAGALLAVSPRTPATLLWGIGGTPEGVISAAGIKCMGGALVGRLWPRDDDERKAAEDAGYDVAKILTHDDLVKGDDAFFSATGVTDGDVLQGVRYHGAARRLDRVAGHAHALRHGAADHVGPRPREAAVADRLLGRASPASARARGRPPPRRPRRRARRSSPTASRRR